MSTGAAWRWCLAAGLLAVLCSIGFGRIPGLHACGDTGGLGPILAFELARTPADVARLFGAEPCRSTLVAAQRTGLWLDALGFIPSYAVFLSLAVLATGHRWRRWIAGAVIVAALCDQIEGALLFAILRDLPGTPASLHALSVAVRLKFLLLGMATLLTGAALINGRRPVSVALGAIVATAGLWAWSTRLDAPAAMMAGFTVAWAALLVAAALGAAWPRLLAPRLPAPVPPSA